MQTDLSPANPAVRSSARLRRHLSPRRHERLTALIFLLPATLLLLTFMFYPIANTFWLSLHRVNQFGRILDFRALDNYADLWATPAFRQALARSIVWTLGIVSFTTLFSLYLGVTLNTRFPGRTVARGLLLLPWAASLTISAVIWRWIAHSDFGVLNHILRALGILDGRFDWLANPTYSFPLMIWIGIWVSIPSTTIFILAGLQSIPADLYEAAKVDGARAMGLFYFVTLPLLRPVLVVTILLNTIYGFNSFPIIWVLTEGGPANKTDILVTYLYKVGFRLYEMGLAAAVSVIVFLILLLFAIAYTTFSWKEVAE
jgi:multiple sugar transport system permease protein